MIQGDLVAYFESGNTTRSVQTITYNKEDPGGKSYGEYQISARSGTLKKYLSWSTFGQKFKEVNPASKEFDEIWIHIAKKAPKAFAKDQYDFIYATHFVPVQNAAKQLGFNVNSFAINEALFSIGVQHGRYKTILQEASKKRISKTPTIENDIDCLYDARTEYVKRLGLPEKISSAIIHRYVSERYIVSEIAKVLDPYVGNDSSMKLKTLKLASFLPL